MLATDENAECLEVRCLAVKRLKVIGILNHSYLTGMLQPGGFTHNDTLNQSRISS
ncbi:hypothetical protein ALON55S_03659 [Alishewanella longhuensis]